MRLHFNAFVCPLLSLLCLTQNPLEAQTTDVTAKPEMNTVQLHSFELVMKWPIAV